MELKDLLADEQFISEIIPLDSLEEVQAAFKERDVELTVEQCEELGAEIKRIITATDNELSKISGGKLNKFIESIKLGTCLSPLGSLVVPMVLNDLPAKKRPYGAGIFIGSVLSLAATIGAYELIKFGGKKVGNWIRDRKTKSREGQ